MPASLSMDMPLWGTGAPEGTKAGDGPDSCGALTGSAGRVATMRENEFHFSNQGRASSCIVALAKIG